MKKLLLKATLILLLSTLILSGLCWYYADQILDGFARPQIEKIAAQLLAAQVQIRQLIWTENGLEMRDLQIDAPDQWQLAVPRTKLDFTIGSLWQRQLDTLHISTPRIEIFPTQKQGGTSTPAPEIPQELPFTIKKLTVSNGRLLLHTAGRQWQLHNLKFSGTLQQNIEFNLSAFFGPDEEDPLDISGSASLPQQQLTLTNISWQKQQLLTAPLQIRLSGTDFTLGSSTLRLAQFDHRKLRSILSALGQAAILPEELEFSLTDATIGFALEQQALKLDLQIAAGQLGWNDLSSPFTALTLQIEQAQSGWNLAGQLQGPAATTINFKALFADKNKLTGQAQVVIPKPGHLKTTLLGGPPLKISGGLQLTAEYSLKGNQFTLTTVINGRSVEPTDNHCLINVSELRGQGSLLFAAGNEEFALALQLASHPFLSVNGNFQRLNFSLTSSALQDLKKLLPTTQFPKQLRSVSGLKASGQLSRGATHWSGSAQLFADQITLPALTLNQLSGYTKLQFTSDQVNFEGTSGNVEITRGDELSAQVNIHGSGNYSPQKFSLRLPQLSVTQLNYMSPDGQSGLGEAALELRGEISGRWPDGPIALNLHGNLAAQEVLAGEFYADLSTYRPVFFLTGDLLPRTGEFNAGEIKIELAQLGTLVMAGRFSPEKINIQGEIKLTDLAESYGEHIGPLLSETQPALAGLTLEGATSLNYNLFWQPDGWQSNGTLQLQGLDAYWERQQLEIVDGSGSIPFAVSSGIAPAKKQSGAEHLGEISFGSLSAGLADLAEGRLQLAAANNRFRFRSPLLLQLAGGRVAIENLELGWPSGKLQGSVKINIAEVDLETLTEELGLPAMQGRFSGDLGTIRYADRQLNTDGLVNIEVFGGQFQLRNMRFTDPFSSYPIFYTDIDFSALDLLQATQTFDFGEMNGLLSGHIYGLKLFGSTPAAFEAAVSTDKKGKRNISVKALNNLSILSQGGISAALSRGIYRFIDFYRYQKIGFKCSLENDTFTLLGTALPGSDRYLVHGGLFPPRIDITTSTPTISFKEMMNRLSRIERAGN